MPDTIALDQPKSRTDQSLVEFQLRGKLDRLFHVYLELQELDLPVPSEVDRLTREVCVALGLIR